MLYSPRSFSSTNRALASIALLAFQVMNRFYNALLLRPAVSGMSPVCSVHHVVPGLYLENSPGALALGTWTGMASPEMRILSAGRVEPTPLSTALLPTSRKGREKWGTPFVSSVSTKNKLSYTPAEISVTAASAGVRGLSFNYVVMQDECRVELYVDRGKDSDEENKQIFDQLYANRQTIEQAFGGTLGWERLEARRACRIQYTRQEGGYRSAEEQWPQIQDKTIHDMDRFVKAL
jgi:hypothetical protein